MGGEPEVMILRRLLRDLRKELNTNQKAAKTVRNIQELVSRAERNVKTGYR